MGRVPKLVEHNEMYRWGRNDGRREGVLWTLGAIAAAAVAAVIVFVWMS